MHSYGASLTLDTISPRLFDVNPQGVTPQQMIAREFALVYQPTTVSAVNVIQVGLCARRVRVCV